MMVLRHGEYRLMRQAGGRGAYAHVRVEAVPARAGSEDRVQWSVDPADPASAQPARDPELVRSALDGAKGALDDLGRIGVDTRDRTVRVTFVGMNVVDTEATAVRAAAAAATVASFDAADRFEVTFDGGWHCRPRDAS